MQFCVISPACALERFAATTHRHLVLTHVKNPVYREWYRRRREIEDCIILDNSAYENKMKPEELLEAIGFYRPQVVVLPDILKGEAKDNFILAKTFARKWRHEVKAEWMFVPQALPGDFVGFIQWLYRAMDEFEPEWIGLPRVLITDIMPNAPKIRAQVCAAIKAKNPFVNVHALGMAHGDVEELHHLSEAGCDSVDSSCAVWRGWNGFGLGDAEWDEYGTDVNFDAHPDTLDQTNVDLIYRNLRKVGVNV